MNKLFCLVFIVILKMSFSQGVAINTTGDDPHDAAILDVSSTNKGLLISRMTTSERDNNVDVTGNPESLLIFNTSKKCFEFYALAVWHPLGFCCGSSQVSFKYKDAVVTYGTVMGENYTCWLDRNLGASRVATSSADTEAYGDLFQWGRLDDGHQERTVVTTNTTLSPTDVPGHDEFIIPPANPWDWRDGQNDNLWQGVNGINNPCPNGWRIPTRTEWEAERTGWLFGNNSTGAYNSPLKLTVSGRRDRTSGAALSGAGTDARYWSSTVFGVNIYILYFTTTGANTTGGESRAVGAAVRCIKD